MDRNRNDRNKESGNGGREGKFSYPDEGRNGGYGTSQGYPQRYGEGGGSSQHQGQYESWGAGQGDYRPGYSTANDFSGQEPVRGRLHRAEAREEGSQRQDSSRRHERSQRSDYPETYRSAMGGYMSEHVGQDRGRKDYQQDRNEGNFYGKGTQHRGNEGDYNQQQQRGYMSPDDYEYGTPFTGTNSGFAGSRQEGNKELGRHKGKGPRNYRRSDDRILEDINERLTEDADVDASDIDVSVKNGEVTLSGRVDDRQAKRKAEDIADSVTGVTHVENRLKTGSGRDAGSGAGSREGTTSGSGADNTPSLPVTPL